MEKVKKINNLKYHIYALICTIVWGITFVSTKVTLNFLSPVQIMFMRFLIGYLTLVLISPKPQKPVCLKEELLFLSAGIFGGTLYYLLENTAVNHTFASNVSLIITTAPIITALLCHFTKQSRLKKKFIYGFLVAFVGVSFIVFNGRFVFKLSPIGDILTLLAAISWAFYTVSVQKIPSSYSGVTSAKRIFFYSLITSIPFVAGDIPSLVSGLSNINVILNLLFLGGVACSMCYVMWNKAIDKLGAVESGNYIYFIPVITLLFSALFLAEPLTIYNILGCGLIILGVSVCSK